MADGGLSDEELLQRLGGLYSEVVVAGVAAELAEARKVAIGENEGAGVARVAAIHARFTYRMHDLSEFMKGLLIRFTRWFNRVHLRQGTLWEERFKSVIVETTPFSPPFGPASVSCNGPHLKSKFLAANGFHPKSNFLAVTLPSTPTQRCPR